MTVKREGLFDLQHIERHFLLIEINENLNSFRTFLDTSNQLFCCSFLALNLVLTARNGRFLVLFIIDPMIIENASSKSDFALEGQFHDAKNENEFPQAPDRPLYDLLNESLTLYPVQKKGNIENGNSNNHRKNAAVAASMEDQIIAKKCRKMLEQLYSASSSQACIDASDELLNIFFTEDAMTVGGSGGDICEFQHQR